MDTCIDTPVIFKKDIVILGGGLKAFAAALTIAEEGVDTLIIEKETFLLEDICLPNLYCLGKGWPNGPSTYDSGDMGNKCRNLYEKIFSSDVEADISVENKRVFHPDRLKQHAEDILEKYGIDYLYACFPLDLSENGDGTKLLRIGGKFGVNGIECKKVLDLRTDMRKQDAFIFHIMDGPDISKEQKEKILCGHSGAYEALLHPGSFGNGHIAVEVPISRTTATMGSLLYSEIKISLEAFQYLKKNVPGFGGIKLGRFAESGFSRDYDAIREIRDGLLSVSQMEGKNVPFYRNVPQIALPSGLELCAHNRLNSFYEYGTAGCKMPGIRRMKQCGITVVGGGTAGVMAAIYAARRGIKTVLVEMNSKLGGTGTCGGVSSYWFGKRFKETIDLDNRIQSYYERLDLTRAPGIWGEYDSFNPDLKSFALMEMCREAGVEVIYGAASFAAVCETGAERSVKGIAAVDSSGAVAVLCRYVIDATGDGDVAAFARAAFNYGSGRDAITYWASLAQYVTPKDYKNNFTSTVVTEDIKDYTRFITEARRRGSMTYDHGTYLAPRESRHIKSLYEITLKDTIAFKEYPDTILTCFSNYDPKGKTTCDMIYAGVLPPQNSIAVPMRAFIPVNEEGDAIDGLLVGGKAFSCTHNAFPPMRMQADMQHQGAVLGLMAGEALLRDVKVQELDMPATQHKIVCETGDTLKLKVDRSAVGVPDRLVRLINKNIRFEWTDFPFEREVKEFPIGIAAMIMPDQIIVPALEERYLAEEDPGDRLMLARMILWHGSDTATQTIMDNIFRELQDYDGLPERKGSVQCVQLLPDHGVMAEMVYKLNILAWSKRTDVYLPFQEVLARLVAVKRDYRDIRKSHYHYVEAFAYVAEHTVLPQFVAMIKRILNFREFAGLERRSRENGPVADNGADIMEERLQILRLTLLRALARCGDMEGYEGLIGLLKHPCLSIGISAWTELKKLTGKSWGMDIDAWNNFIHSSLGRGIFVPKAVTEKQW